MSPEPWRSHVEIDSAAAEQIIAARFPVLRPVRAARLDEGWGFFAFVVNDDLCFRFPKREDVVAAIGRENLLLDTLGDHLTLPVPRNRFFGEPGDDFPFPFAGQDLIPGESALSIIPPEREWPRLAKKLGRFLSKLHSFPAARVREIGLPAWSPRSHTDAEGKMAKEIEGARGILPDELLERCRGFAERELPRYVPHTGDGVMCHDDLLPGHLFLTPDTFELTGVIDWEDAGLGDPAGDFVGLGMWLGSEFVRETLRRYDRPAGRGFAHRVRWWTVWVSILECRYGVLTGREDLRDAALRSLEMNLKPRDPD